MTSFADEKMTDRSTFRKALIDQSKQQQISLISGFRGVARHLKSFLTVEINTEPINLNGLDDVRMLIIPQPKSSFGTGEIETIWRFVEEGGSLMILSGEGGEHSVIRTVFLKYFDPKEALVANGVVNRSIAVAAKKNVSTEAKQNSQILKIVSLGSAHLDPICKTRQSKNKNDTASEILQLADFFGAKTVVRRCEEFLMNHSKEPLKFKFPLAIKYKLTQLRKKCFTQITKKTNFKDFVPEASTDFDTETWKEFYLKFMSLI